MFQDRVGKVDEFGWWDLDFFSVDAGTQFTSTELQDECKTRGVWLTLSALEHQEMKNKWK